MLRVAPGVVLPRASFPISARRLKVLHESTSLAVASVQALLVVLLV